MPPNYTAISPMGACQALDVTSGTLNSWRPQKVFENLDIPETTAGKSRSFTLRAILALSVVRRLGQLGIPPQRSSVWVGKIMKSFDELGANEVTDLFWAEAGFGPNLKEHVGFREDQLPTDAIVTLRVNLTELFKRIERRVREVVQMEDDDERENSATILQSGDEHYAFFKAAADKQDGKG